MDRLSSFALGLLVGVAIGGALAWRAHLERAAVAAVAEVARGDASALRAEHDRLEARLRAAETRARRAERDLERLRPLADDTPAAEAERARRAALREAQASELLRLLADEPVATPATGAR